MNSGEDDNRSNLLILLPAKRQFLDNLLPPRVTTKQNTEHTWRKQMHTPPTGYEPNVLGDFHYSETSEMIFQEESGDIDTEPLILV